METIEQGIYDASHAAEQNGQSISSLD